MVEQYGSVQAAPIQDAVPYTLWWWLGQLEAALDARMPDVNRCEQYYGGKHNLAFATGKFREAFGRLFREFSDNWCELVVDSSVERISVQGFRFNSEDLSGDDDAWAIWQANNLDSESVIGFTTAVKTGMAYVLVGPGDDVDGVMMPQVTIEHPCEVIVATAPGNRRNRQAALKRWVDELGFVNAYVYLPDAIYTFQSEKPQSSQGFSGSTHWLLVDEVRNTLGVVPMIPLPNDPDGRGNGTSDIDQVIPTQDAVNKLMADMMVSSEFNAFSQRWATGLEDIEDETTISMMNALMSGASRIFASASPDTKFGTFPETDLKGFVAGIELIIQHIAARTRTPPHYLLGQSGNFPSGDSLKATETGLVAKVRKKHLFFGEGLTDALRLAFLMRGDTTRGKDMGAKTIWKDPESRSFGELVDGLVKLATIGVPEEFLWQKANFSPQEIKRMQELQAVKLAATAAANAKAAAQLAQVPMLQPATGAKNPNAELQTGLPADPTAPSAQVAR